ncbi:MAG: PEGA domain-containing protein [Bacteroidota bacterium]|jgi:hypothetical protein
MKPYNFICWFIVVFFMDCFVFSGCATIFHGTTEAVDINSIPPGAKLYMNDEYKGTAPCILALSPKNINIIEFRKEGYDHVIKLLESSFNANWLILDIFCDGWIVDMITGAWYTFNQPQVVVEMKKEQSTQGDTLKNPPPKLVEQMMVQSFGQSSKVNTEQDKAYILIHSQIPFLRFDSNRKIDQVNQLSSGDWEVWLPAGTHILKISADGFQRLDLPPMNFGKKRSYEMTIKVDTSPPDP